MKTALVSFGRAGLAVFVIATLSCGRGTEPIAPVVPVLTIVTVTLSSPTIQVAQTASATASGLDQNGASIAVGAVTWSTGSASVASITTAGVVTGVAPGQTVVIASAGGKQGQQSLTVLAVPVASVTVAPSSPSVIVGSTQQLTATTLDANGATLTGRTITWTTSDATKATVSSTGLVTAVAVGAATITATSESRTGTAAITVTPVPVASVTVAPSSPSVVVGGTQQLTVTTLDATGATLTGRTITWTTSDATKAIVSSTGLVTAVAVGTATITATSEGKSGTAAVSVLPVPVATVSVTPATASIIVGATQQLTATTLDAAGATLTGRTITWTTSDATRATVSSTGLVTAVAVGNSTITATSESRTGTAAITVTPVPVASVTVSPSSSVLSLGDVGTVVATPRDANGIALSGRNIAWSSSSGSVASVTSTGVVSALSPGSANIIATVEGKSGSAAITVLLTANLHLSCLPSNLRVPRGSTSTVSCTLSMPAALSHTLTMRSSDFPAGIRLHLLGADTTTIVPAGTSATLFLAADVDSTVASGQYAGTLRAEAGVAAQAIPLTLAVTTAKARVRMIYLIPSDLAYDAQIAWGMERAVRHLQIFFQQQLGTGGTFTVHLPAVEVVHSAHPSSYFVSNAWNGPASDVFAALGGQWYDRANIWAIYFDVQNVNSATGGGASVATMPRGDAQGVAGRDPVQPTRRWIGGLGHEMGHAMGLPHPPGCDAGGSSLDCSSIMYSGVYNYPSTFIAESQKTMLTDSTYVGSGVTTTGVFFNPDVFGSTLVPAAAISSVAESSPVRRTAPVRPPAPHPERVLQPARPRP